MFFFHSDPKIIQLQPFSINWRQYEIMKIDEFTWKFIMRAIWIIERYSYIHFHVRTKIKRSSAIMYMTCSYTKIRWEIKSKSYPRISCEWISGWNLYEECSIWKVVQKTSTTWNIEIEIKSLRYNFYWAKLPTTSKNKVNEVMAPDYAQRTWANDWTQRPLHGISPIYWIVGKKQFKAHLRPYTRKAILPKVRWCDKPIHITSNLRLKISKNERRALRKAGIQQRSKGEGGGGRWGL